MTPQFYLAQPWFLIVAGLVAAAGVARATRIIVHEEFPPARWLRHKWISLTKGGDWAAVVTCHWCNPPYLVAGSLIWFAAGLFWWEPLIWAWWAVHLWAALSYLASWIVHHDEDGRSTD